MNTKRTYNQLTTEEFIAKAKTIHEDKYDYSLVDYTNNTTKVCIICPIHGEFWQKPQVHMLGCGCKKCGIEVRRKQRVLPKEEFIKRAFKVHGGVDDFSKMTYVNPLTKVCIITPEYGEINITPKGYLRWKRNPPKQKLTYAYCKKVITQCNYNLTLINKDYPHIISCIRQHKWEDLISIINRKWHEPWTDKTCEDESRKYTSKKDFERGSNGAYNYAVKHNIINNFSWLTTPIRKSRDPNLKEYTVYAYEDNRYLIAYIGLTIDLKRRDRQHRNGSSKNGVKEYDSLAKYYMSLNKPIPSPKVLISNLSQVEAQFYENEYKEKYISNGYTVLNKGKTGINSSSLGGAVIKWDYYGCLTEAKKYNTLREFIKSTSAAYSVAKKQNWIKDYIWFKSYKRRTKWSTYKSVKEEAIKCYSKIDFKSKNAGAYQASLDNFTQDGIKWIDTFTWFKDTNSLLSETHKGKPCKNIESFHSKTARDKARLSNIGKTRTEEQKQLMSAKAYKRPVYQIDKDSGAIIRQFESAKCAAKSLGKNYGSVITSCCNGTKKTAYGYKWQYVDKKTSK